jgi:Pentapeptide repeats (8 copies)
METFEPPKYLTSLIAAVNEAAKSAQTGALAFTVVGLYLFATAFSTTDEDLLLEHTMPVSQIGVQVPVVFSFAIAPTVFLFLHIYTLIRFDMLAANLCQFRSDLHLLLPHEADRERCRQLAANIEFVQARIAPASSALHSRLYGLMAWLILTGLPVLTLIVVQISSLRYQSNAVTETQRVCLGLDLILLIWFFYRQRRREKLGGNSQAFGRARVFRLCLPAAIVLVVDLLYLNVPRPDAQTVLHLTDPFWAEAYKQPLDLVLCPSFRWDCRYLTLDHRTLVAHVWKAEVIGDLRAGQQEDIKKSLAAIEGVFLGGRKLRFANFDESRLYAVDLREADLTHASLVAAQLQGANMGGAYLIGAYLERANLTGADLGEADLFQATPTDADLSEVSLYNTDLSGADLLPPRLGAKITITQAQLNESCGDSDTKLPPGLTIPQCSPPRPFRNRK